MLVEFFYDQAGTKVGFTETDGTRIEQEVRVNYIQVPVLGRANFKARADLRRSDVCVQGEPEQKVTVNGVEVPDDEEASLKGNDMGITIGAGFDISSPFVIDVRYTWGLMEHLQGFRHRRAGREDPAVRCHVRHGALEEVRGPLR